MENQQEVYDWDAHDEEELVNLSIEQARESRLELEHIKQNIYVYSVVQIAPDAEVSPGLRGAFAIVDEVRAWGVIASVSIITNVIADESPDHAFQYVAPVRLQFGTFKLVGQSQYDPDDY